jgi:hypothetical protein
LAKEIRIYVEGGGDSKDGRAELRKGFNGFFKEIVEAVREKRLEWSVVACGSRNSTFDDFNTALKSHPDAFNVLLVDSEGPVSSDVRSHLKQRDRWDLSAVDDEQCHLMVQFTESWLIADVACLKRYYGKGFIEKRIPKGNNVELISKDDVETGLKGATSKTQKKTYHKARHCPQILKVLEASKVRAAAPHCERLFATLEQVVNSE